MESHNFIPFHSQLNEPFLRIPSGIPFCHCPLSHLLFIDDEDSILGNFFLFFGENSAAETAACTLMWAVASFLCQKGQGVPD
jgi:hypothetical protein